MRCKVPRETAILSAAQSCSIDSRSQRRILSSSSIDRRINSLLPQSGVNLMFSGSQQTRRHFIPRGIVIPPLTLSMCICTQKNIDCIRTKVKSGFKSNNISYLLYVIAVTVRSKTILYQECLFLTNNAK